MATQKKVELTKHLGYEDPNALYKNLKIPPQMLNQPEPVMALVNNYGNRADVQGQEPAAMGTPEQVPIPQRMPAQEAPVQDGALIQDQATQAQVTPQQAVAENVAPADELYLEDEPLTEEAAAQEAASQLSALAAPAEEGVSSTDPSFLTKLRSYASGLDDENIMNPWNELIDFMTGSKNKLASSDKGTDAVELETAKLLHKEKMQQKRADELQGRDLTKYHREDLKTWWQMKPTYQELKDALKIDTDSKGKQGIRLGRLQGVLNKFVKLGGGVGTQTEADIARVWSGPWETYLAKLKTLAGNNLDAIVPVNAVMDLVDQLNAAMVATRNIVRERINYTTDNAVLRGMSQEAAQKYRDAALSKVNIDQADLIDRAAYDPRVKKPEQAAAAEGKPAVNDATLKATKDAILKSLEE